MNVSMQDGFNLGWKLGHVLEGRSPESLLVHLLGRAPGGREEPHRLRQGVVDAHGEEARGVRRPLRARGLLRAHRRVPGRVHDRVRAVHARRPSRRTRTWPPASRSASASSPRRVVARLRHQPAAPRPPGHGRRPLAHLRLRRRGTRRQERRRRRRTWPSGSRTRRTRRSPPRRRAPTPTRGST